MNTIYIMIIFFGYRGGVTTAEFNSLESCNAAKYQIINYIDPNYAAGVNSKSIICVKK